MGVDAVPSGNCYTKSGVFVSGDVVGDEGKHWCCVGFTSPSTAGTWTACDNGPSSSGDVTDVGAGCATGACWTDGLVTTGTVMWTWEGTTADTAEVFWTNPTDPAFDLEFVVTAPTAGRTVTFPDEGGTVCVGGTGAGCPVDTGPSPDCSGTTTYQDGEGGCDTLHAGTDITADLEEEAHCSEHASADLTCSGETLLLATDSVTHDEANYQVSITAPDDVVDSFSDQCYWFISSTGGGVWCEGSLEDDFQQLYLFPDINEDDTTRRIVVNANEVLGIEGLGLQLVGSVQRIELNATLDGVGVDTSLSGMEFTATGGLALLQHCLDTETLVWNDTSGTWDCGPTGGSEVNNLETVTTDIQDDELAVGTAANTVVYKILTDCNAAGEAMTYDTATNAFGCITGLGAGGTVDSIQGDDDVATAGAVLSVDGGTGGIDTDVVGDVMTVTFDATEVDGPTWGNATSSNWTFDVGATDPVFEFTSGNVKYSGATTYTFEGGAADPVWTPGNGVMNLTTGTLQEGGSNVLLDSDLGGSVQAWDAELDTIAALTETNDAVMFVVGSAWTADLTPAINGADFTGIVGGGLVADTLDFTEFADAMSLDASTSITAGVGEQIVFNTSDSDSAFGAGGFVINATFADDLDATDFFQGLEVAITNNSNDGGDNTNGIRVTIEDSGQDGADTGVLVNYNDSLGSLTNGFRCIGSNGGVVTNCLSADDADITNIISYSGGTITASSLNIIANNEINALDMAVEDFGDFTCDGGAGGCTLDAGAAANSFETWNTDTNPIVADSSTDTAAITSGLGLLVDGTTATDSMAVTITHTETLAGNPALLADECIHVATAAGGGALCEGGVANTNEQLYLFPDVDGVDTTNRIVVDGTEITNVDGNDLTITAGQLDVAVTVARLAGPALTGDPTAPTASVNDNDTSIATTAFVQAETLAGDVSGTLSTTQVDDVQSATSNLEAADNSTTQVATTSFVQQEINGAGGTDLSCSGGQCNVDAVFLPLAGGTMTGAVVADEQGVEFLESDDVVTCAAGDFWIRADLSEATLKKCLDGVESVLDTTGGTPDFSQITTGTNTTATMTVGTGAAVTSSGTGSIVATTGDTATSFFAAGTIDEARLDANVVLDNAANTYTAGAQDFSSAASVTFAANEILSSEIATEVRSLYWGAGAISVNAASTCAAASEVEIGSWDAMYTIVCTDANTSTMTGSAILQDSWDAGTITFELAYIQDAADTAIMNADVKARCVGPGETPAAYGTEVAIDDAAVTGSDAMDFTTSGAVTPAGTCVAGDFLQWSVELDVATTTAVATLHFVGVKPEYTSNVGDE